MSYSLHPAAATEHTEHVAYYEARQPGLGLRYNTAFRIAMSVACEAPLRCRIALAPSIRLARLGSFPFSVLFREIGGNIQVLAIAHHRQRPGYWLNRL